MTEYIDHRDNTVALLFLSQDLIYIFNYVAKDRMTIAVSNYATYIEN